MRKEIPNRAPVKEAAARKGAVAKVPVAKAAVKKVPVKRASVTRAPAKKPSTRPDRALRVVPDPEPPRSSSAAKRSAERDGVKTRATVPGWADVLLGTAPGSDR